MNWRGARTDPTITSPEIEVLLDQIQEHGVARTAAMKAKDKAASRYHKDREDELMEKVHELREEIVRNRKE